MDAKHTLGPWVTDGKFIRGTDNGRAMDGYEYIAQVFTDYLDSPIDRKEANAKLIAAARNRPRCATCNQFLPK